MINYTRVVPLYTPGYTVGNYCKWERFAGLNFCGFRGF